MASIYGENVKFICGRPFDSEYGHHNPGEEVKEAPQFHLLETLVRAGLLVPYAPDEGYDYLPPHLYSLLNTKAEAEAILNPDPSPHLLGKVPWEGHGKPEVVRQSETAVKAADDHRAEQRKRETQQTAKRAEAQKNPPARKSVADTVAKKTAAKKAAEPKEKK